MSTPTWNVRDHDGVLVDDLATFADTMGMSQKRAAAALTADPTLLAAAPRDLQVEAKAAARPKPGDGTPPPIDSGSFVSWNGGKGRVDLVVTNGKVPGVSEDVEGSAKTPAARVVVYDSDGKATSKKIGASTHTLRRIPPIKGSREGKSVDQSALVAVVSDHEAAIEEKGLPAHCAVTGYAVKAVYDRGLDGYPGPEVTDLSPQGWAMGRVQHFVKAAALDVPRAQAGNDVDLLAPEHPLYRAPAPQGTEPVGGPAAAPERERDEHGQQVEMKAADVAAQIAALSNIDDLTGL